MQEVFNVYKFCMNMIKMEQLPRGTTISAQSMLGAMYFSNDCE